MNRWLYTNVVERIDKYNNYYIYERNDNYNHILIVLSWTIKCVINLFITSFKILTMMKLLHSTFNAHL